MTTDTSTTAFFWLGLLTCVTMLLAGVMIARLVPVEYGMLVCGLASFVISYFATRSLMGRQRPWRPPSYYRED
jgi:cytochrome b subunit of formate dehydrogenase